ncbi:MAG: hypothetical protein P9L99_12640 [Candidatus Lernaella stagnicola]|nr:hypothetical protein [Candidatus Lernaella stagnicola]
MKNGSRLAAVVLSVALLWLSGCAGASYYRDLKFDEHYELVGDQPLSHKEAAQTKAYRMSEKRGVTHIRFLDAGRPVLEPRFGVAEIRMRDEDGKRIYEFLNHLGLPMPSGRLHRIVFERNTTGQTVARRNLNHLGFPVRDERGVATYRFGLDKAGRVVEVFFEGRDGQPTRDNDGVASLKIEYDLKNRPVRVTHGDESGKPIVNRGGIAMRWWEYDSEGRLAASSTHGLNQLMVNGQTTGFAQVRFEYNKAGMEASRRFLDAQGEPAVDRRIGANRVQRWYDEIGNVVMESYLDAAGQAVVRPELGAARVAWTRDEKGRITAEEFFGVDQQPCAGRGSGAMRIEWKFNAAGLPVRQSFHGLNGPVAHAVTGVAAILWEYGSHGEVTREQYRDAADKPATRRDSGVAEIRYLYNKSGYRTHVASYGPENELRAIRGLGFAQTVTTYDRFGNIVERRYLSAKGHLVDHPVYAYAVAVVEYDTLGYVVKTEYRNAAGHLVRVEQP